MRESSAAGTVPAPGPRRSSADEWFMAAIGVAGRMPVGRERWSPVVRRQKGPESPHIGVKHGVPSGGVLSGLQIAECKLQSG